MSSGGVVSTCSAMTLKLSVRASLIIAVTIAWFTESRLQVAGERAVDLQVNSSGSAQVRERTDARAEVVERETATHAVQHADEAARMVEVRDHRVLGHLEAQLCGRDAGTVEAVDDELQELRVAEGLPGTFMATQRPAGTCSVPSTIASRVLLHDPAVDQAHQPVCSAARMNSSGWTSPPASSLHPHQHLDRRAVAAGRPATAGNDRLRVELEALVA